MVLGLKCSQYQRNTFGITQQEVDEIGDFFWLVSKLWKIILAEQKFYCFNRWEKKLPAKKLPIFIDEKKSCLSASVLSRNDDPVTQNNPQTLLWAVLCM